MKNSLIPELRFPEFVDDWDVKTLDQLTTRIGDGIHSTPKYNDNGNYYFINGNNLANGEIKIFDTTKKVEEAEAKKYNKELSDRTILLSINGTIGNLAFYNNEKVMLGKSAAYINLKNKVNKVFIYNVLKTSKTQNFFFSELTGSTIKNLSLKTIRETEISIPTPPEQTKIANFLTAVDKRINLLQKKKAELEQYKKGVMQILFSQEIRFKDENGNDFPDWEEKKLGEVCKIVKGKQLNATELTEEGTYPAINGGIQPSGYTEDWNTIENTITISEGGNSCGYVNFIKTKFWSGGHCYSLLDLDDEVINKFLYQLLKFYERNIMRLRVGSGLPNIQKGDINNFQLLFPKKEEQQKIANFLSSIDTYIEKLDNQKEQSQQWKKGLLQKMFV